MRALRRGRGILVGRTPDDRKSSDDMLNEADHDGAAAALFPRGTRTTGSRTAGAPPGQRVIHAAITAGERPNARDGRVRAWT